MDPIKERKMRSFSQFLGNKIVDRQMKECANLMVLGEVDPNKFVERYFETLDSDLSEGFWSDMAGKAKDAWNRWTSAGSKVARSVYDGGLKSGLKQGHDIVAGPKVKFDKAMETLKGVAKFLQSNEKTSGMASRIDPQLTIAKHLEKMIDILSKEVMPALGDPQVTQDYNRAGGAAPAAQNAPATQAGAKPQMNMGDAMAAGAYRPEQAAAQNMAAKQPFTASPGNTPREDDETQRKMRYRQMTRQESRRP